MVITCPRCGRPSGSVVASSTRFSCGSCGYQGEPPAELTQAAQALSSIDAVRRQLTEKQHAALLGRGKQRRRMATIVGVLAPFAAFWLLSMYFMRAKLWAQLMLGFWPLGLLALSLGALWHTVRRTIAELERACAATPPQTPGEPASCHVCGGPLPGGQGIVERCRYCQADNLVDPEAMRRVSARQASEAGSLEGEVTRRAQALSRTGALAGLSVVPLALAALSVSFVSTVVIWAVLAAIHQPLDPASRYALVETPAGRCLVSVAPQRAGQGVELHAGATRPVGLPSVQKLASEAGLQMFDVATLVGRGVRRLDGEHEDYRGVVTDVYSTPAAYEAHMTIRLPDGRTHHQWVDGLCFTDEER